MIFGVVNKSTTENRFVLHTGQRNITHLAVITRETNKKTRYFERGKLEKSPDLYARSLTKKFSDVKNPSQKVKNRLNGKQIQAETPRIFFKNSPF